MSRPTRRKGQALPLRPDEQRGESFAAFERFYASPYGKLLLRARARLNLTDPKILDSYLFLQAQAPEPGGPPESLRVLVAATRVGLPAPRWARRVFIETVTARIEGRVPSLDEAFGFSASGRGAHRKAPVYQLYLDQRNEMLAFDVHRLRVLGVKLDDAIARVAAKLKRSKGWNRTAYRLELDRRDCADPAERDERLHRTLRDVYYQWKDANPLTIKDPEFRARIRENKDAILASLPAASV